MAEQAKAKTFPQSVKEILAETKNQLSSIYSMRLKVIILFGSYACGDYAQESDLDLLLLLEDMPDPAAERARYLPVVCDLSLKYDTLVSIIPMDYKTYQTHRTPLILNIRREGVRL